ncbi:hypothetical protein ACTWP5_05610 [Streptomyces sp. 4N509B]|uniref:hypothetical protein n=1 Tax=Streptomyces sp. 4N509B TaxID=3457413 RepID=UPI003FD1E3CB
MSKLKDHERADIIRRYAAGESLRGISRDFGSQYLVRKVLVNAGIAIRPAPEGKRLGSWRRREVAAILEKHHDDIIETYLGGSSLMKTGDRFGLNHATVERFLRDQGVPIRTFEQAHSLRVRSRVQKADQGA